MAEAFIPVAEDQFVCSVCLDLLKDPVTLACGHSYCMVCINNCWDQEAIKGFYSCPQCRDHLYQRPVLRRNTILAEVINELKKTEAASSAHCYAAPGDVACDFCTGKKLKAIKSCLMCMTSFCETHLKPHLELLALKKHTLIEASLKLQDKACSQHGKLLDFYCRSDQKCICSLCVLDNHKGHDTITLLAERNEKEKKLKEEQKKSQQRIQERQKKEQELKCSVVRIKVQLSQAEQNLKQVEQEIIDLKKKDTELEQLSYTQDHVHFLQSFQSLCATSGPEDKPSNTLSKRWSFHETGSNSLDLTKLGGSLGEFYQKTLNRTQPEKTGSYLSFPTFGATGPAVREILPLEPKSREDFLKYFRYLSLDPNTTHCFLCLSENNKVASFTWKQLYVDHPDRFEFCSQVLCKESVHERCYWEVEWSGVVHISVAYKEIWRKGKDKECGFGRNNQSWSLRCSSSSLFFYHNDIKNVLSIPPSSKIGVYVDHRAGSLSFYNVSDTMRLLHRVHNTFTQPLYAGFGLYGGTVRLCNAK
ncbi:E3 ubiquitin/ISG15 ligase TRIM25-like [Clarias gariepinus]|uniref:E3 ubiquitin/ISG15 ligase TRIM25-like n=1 Tax=Clarias gariepinus TaxID=13013 RepID=UPI00234E0FF5|nr:E3 ubiquitin/ISG15 ligase TRIM25-like [Clarias gariepinus]